MRKLYILLSLSFFSITTVAQTITLEAFGPSFSHPTNIKSAGDSRLFVVDQEGFIYVLKSDGTSPSTPFLDIDSLVYNDFQSEWERGLLGVAFHPNYSSNGYFYVHYVDQSGDSVISRFSVTANPDIADASSELVIMNIPHPYDAHYGSDIVFGSDGYLYISKGDGGHSAGDPDNRSQDLNQLLGKILRIDVDNPEGGKNYGVPDSNPFKNDGDPNTREEIWEYGLRNPAKFSFDSLTGDLWIGEVGQSAIEEINLDSGNTGGHNFGWSCYEGNSSFNSWAGCPSYASTTAAIHHIGHFESGEPFRCAVTGGYRHRGSINTNLNGTYFFADWCSGEILMLNESGGSWTRSTYIPPISNQRWVAFAEDNDGELYIIGNSGGDGVVYKIKQDLLSTNDIVENNHFTIIPNPANNNSITLTFDRDITLDEVNVYNLHGQKVQSQFEYQNSKVASVKFNSISSGIYIIEVKSKAGGIYQNKLVIK